MAAAIETNNRMLFVVFVAPFLEKQNAPSQLRSVLLRKWPLG
jgi:hypothetical protein